MLINEKFMLSNGLYIPKIGLGTWQISDEDVVQAVCYAIKCGYRHIDTAIDYGNEVGVGKGIKESGIDRKDLFITSKIPAHIKTYQEAKQCILESLKRLDVEYIDLMLIHSPRPWELLWDAKAPRYYQENLNVYKALEEAMQEGLIKSIGLSNFFIDDVRNILENCKIKPVVNQICVFIGNTPKELIKYCQENNILVEAYSPIATGRLLNNDILKNVANKYDVSIACLCIRYCLQLGTLPLPKSTNKNHIKENLNVDFVISDDDMKILLNL